MMVLGIILGIAFALCFSYLVTMEIVCKSNDMGDSIGGFQEFSDSSVHIIQRKDAVNPNYWDD